MNEERVHWAGGPSQWRNAGWFAASLLLLPLPWAVWRWLDTRCTRYTLTDQRLQIRRGVLSQVTEDLELYRVRDTRFQQSAWERLLGLGEIVLFTADASTPTISLRPVRDAGAVRETLRALVEARRDAKRVRTLDAEGFHD